MKGALLGPAFSWEEVRAFLVGEGIPHQSFDAEGPLLELTARAIQEGAIVGWFSGRMEFGPRALGARSILADARNPATQATLNARIKFRESFRPFAPSVLREHASDYFDLDHESPYMLLVGNVKSRLQLEPTEAGGRRPLDSDPCKRASVPRSTIPAVTHIDMSARIQTVDAERHGRFYRLLREFHRQTGCPLIVNTSFNVRGEPLVATPRDAYRCFMATDMDVLVIEHCVLHKREQPAISAAQQRRHLDRFSPD
jgi:carbamoyltransferase